jgi:hypothetical protein
VAFRKVRQRLPPKLKVLGSFGPLLLMLVFAAANYASGSHEGLESKGNPGMARLSVDSTRTLFAVLISCDGG